MSDNIAFHAELRFALLIQNGPSPESGGAIAFAKNVLEMGLHEPENIECLIDLPK